MPADSTVKLHSDHQGRQVGLGVYPSQKLFCKHTTFLCQQLSQQLVAKELGVLLRPPVGVRCTDALPLLLVQSAGSTLTTITESHRSFSLSHFSLIACP